MNDYSDTYWEEWDRLVNEAKENLLGTCPLLCDETILWINDHMKSHDCIPLND